MLSQSHNWTETELVMICLNLHGETRTESGRELPKVQVCFSPTGCFTKHGERSVAPEECPLAKLVLKCVAGALATTSFSVDCH